MFKWIKKIIYKPAARQADYINGVFGKNAVASANQLLVLYKEHYGVAGELIDFEEIACVVGFLVVHSLNRCQYETKLTDEQEFQIGVGIYLKACYLSSNAVDVVSKINQFKKRFDEYKLVWQRMQYSKSMSEMAGVVSAYVIVGEEVESAMQIEENIFSETMNRMIVQISQYCD